MQRHADLIFVLSNCLVSGHPRRRSPDLLRSFAPAAYYHPRRLFPVPHVHQARLIALMSVVSAVSYRLLWIAAVARTFLVVWDALRAIHPLRVL
jgi:hypothetical protein